MQQEAALGRRPGVVTPPYYVPVLKHTRAESVPCRFVSRGRQSPENVPRETGKDIEKALKTPGQNYGKDSYVIDLTGSETAYWLGTESGLLGAFLTGMAIRETTYTYSAM